MKKKNPSFQEALNAASLWCDAWQKEELSDEVLADRIAELLETKIGARAFFVISLSSESALLDRIPEPLLVQLSKAAEIVVDLTVRNLAMSSAMSLHHKRNKNHEMHSSSERIKRRCIDLLKILDTNSVKKRVEILLSATQGEGSDTVFLERWNYDNEQKAAIKESIYSIAQN